MHSIISDEISQKFLMKFHIPENLVAVQILDAPQQLRRTATKFLIWALHDANCTTCTGHCMPVTYWHSMTPTVPHAVGTV